jgi:hypothetical protein
VARAFGARRVAVLAIAALIASSLVFAQGVLTTSDGMRMSVSGGGQVSSLQSNGVEYASGAVTSGFVYREYPASVASVVPNGSFETGTTSWSWSGGTGGTWSWDAATGAVGTHSMKMTISGTVAKRSPMLTSSQFSIVPNAAYTFSCQVKTSGLSKGLDFYLLEQDASGTWVQRGLAGKSGTTGWTTLSLTYTSGPKAVKAYFKIEEYSGYGTAWVDDVKLVDLFSSRLPVAFGGTVSSDAGGLTQTGSANGLSLSARYTSVGNAIKVDATLTDTTGADRAVELGFRLPLDGAAGWSWEQNLVTSTPIVDGKRYENLDTVFGQQTHSVYPFGTVKNSSAAFSLATPMVAQMNRFSYDTAWGLRVTWDLGLSPAATKTPSKATVTFWIYTQSPKWGLRATAEKYYALNPGNFTSTATLNGAWVLEGDTPLSTVPNWRDFGWGLDEAGDLDFDNPNGIIGMHYVDPSGWFRSFPSYANGPQPPYSVLVSSLLADAASGTGTTVDGAPVKTMAQAVVNSSPFDETGQYQVDAKSYFWYGQRQQIYPVLPDPDIPAPSMWSMLTKYMVDNQASGAQSAGRHLDGIFLDDITSTFGNVENHRRALWAHSDVPLTFSYATRKVMQFDGFSTAEFLATFRSYLHGKGMSLMTSVNYGMYSWYAPAADIIGGETDVVESADRAYTRRTLSYGKPWSMLWVNTKSSAAPDGPTVLAYLRQALLLGYFPGFAGEYWGDPTAYERDRQLVKQYIGLIRKTTAAGWRPVNYATPSDPAIYVERFDDQAGSLFYLTAQNSSASAKTFQLTLDGAGLGLSAGAVTVKELVGNTTMSVSRSGLNALFTDTLQPGETALYEISESGAMPAPPPPPPPAVLPANGSFELGATGPSSWTLGTSSFAGTWTWDVSNASEGTHGMKLDVAGSIEKKSPYLTSASFALSPGRSYTLSVDMKTSGVGGRYAPAMYVVEMDADGHVLRTPKGASLQHNASAPTGTSSWQRRTVTFTTDPRCAKAYVYANIYNGYGIVWMDNVTVR